MLDFHRLGVPTVDYGNNIRQMAQGGGRRRRLRLSRLRAGLYPAAVLPRHRPVPLGGAVGRSRGHLPHRRQGEGADARRHASAQLARHGARAHPVPGPAGAHLLGRASATGIGSASPSTRWSRTGELKAPIVIGRDHLDSGSVASPNRETEAMRDGSDAVSDWPLLNALLNCASRRDLGVAASRRRRRHGLFAARRHGDRLRRHARRRRGASARVLWNDPATGVMRHADAGYEDAIDCAREQAARSAEPRTVNSAHGLAERRRRLDSLVFLDDDPFVRNRVREALPMAAVR